MMKNKREGSEMTRGMGRCDPCSPCNTCGLPVIGVYPLTNLGSVLVHVIDEDAEKVLASINGTQPEWYEMSEEYSGPSVEEEAGFWFGELWIPWSEVLKV